MYIDPGTKPLTGTITFTYKRTNTSGVPVYAVSVTNGAGYNNGSYYKPFEFAETELPVYAYESDGSTPITLTDDGINITATNIDSYIDNTGADAEWKYWLLAGTGTGSDNKQYTFTLKYNASTTVGTFASSLADAEVTSLYQGQTKIGYSSVATTVTEYKTGKYLITATFTGTNGKKYVVTADYIDDCVATDDGGTQGDVPCTAYFTLDQMEIRSQSTYGNALCNADWKTPNGWSKTFTVLQATNSEGASIKLFFSDISTQEYNGINSPAARDYAFANAGMDQDYTYLAETSCFSFIGNENLYYYGFIYDENGTQYVPAQWYDYSNVAVGKGTIYYGSNAWFPGGNSDPDNDYVYASYHTICPYWSYYVCPNNSTKNYFDSDDIIHVEQKSDGSVFIQVRDKNDASMVYVQIGTTTVDQGGSGGGEIVTPTIKLDTYVNGRGSVTVSPEECLYAVGATITLTPVAETDWTFIGWTGTCANQITDNGNGTYTYTVPANDCSVIANFEEGNTCTYNVSFVANGGSGTMETQTFNCGVGGKLNPIAFTGPEVTVTYNYHGATSGNSTPSVTVNKPFGVWEDDSDAEDLHDDEESVNFSVSNGDVVTMTALWDPASVTLPTPEKTGFTFNGWYTEETGGTLKGTGGANVIIAGDITLHAQWTANTYTVHFDSNHGEAADEMGDQTFTYDVEQALAANAFAWEGHTFLGWATEENGGVVYTDRQTVSNLTDEPDGTVNLYAVWKSDLLTVRFEDYDGTELQTYQLEPNAVPSYEGTPVRENEGDEYNWYEFAFTGWTDGDNNTYAIGAELPAVMGDVTYTAQYSKKLYIILQENMDADYYTNFHNKYNGERATTATLNRQFEQGQWATLCFPFNVSTAQLTSLGMINRIYDFKYTKGDEQEGITLYFSQAKKLEAGKGYIVNANATLAKKESFVFSNVLINTNMDEQSGFDISNLTGYNSQGNVYLVGTLRTGQVFGSEAGGRRYMGLKDNKFLNPTPGQGTRVLGYRGIFLNTGEESLPARVRIVAESEEGEIVSELEVVNGGLEETSATRKFIRNGILYIERNGELFDAKGQRAE